jgi:hypothetical protein
MPLLPQPCKPWFMATCDFYKLRAEMRPTQRAYALVAPRVYLSPVLVYILVLAYKPSSHAELATEIEATFHDPFTVSSSDA